jgi:hypothetical protein
MANNWYNKQEMRSGVMSIIIRDLEALPDSYSPAQYRQKVEEVYRYVRAYFENYSGGDGPLTA